MNIRYRVELTQSERDELTALLSGGRHAARRLKRAQILLAADAGAGDAQIAATVRVSGSTIYRTKRRFVEANLEGALSEEPRPGAALYASRYGLTSKNAFLCHLGPSSSAIRRRISEIS